MKNNPKVVEAFFKAHGVPAPKTEYKFHPERKWRFDYAWEYDFLDGPSSEIIKVALEVEGGVWTGGRHTSGAGFIKDMEKYNAAACLGWFVLRCQPKHVLTKITADMIKQVLSI